MPRAHPHRTTHLSRPSLLVASGVLLLIAGGPLLAATVNIRLIDEKTGKPTPAMICITDIPHPHNSRLPGVRLPPDGQVCEGPSLTKAFYKGIDFDPDRNWVGPVRMMLGKGDNNDRSYVYEERPSIPWWPAPMMYQVSGDFTIELPPGRYQLAISHGMEYKPISTTIHITDADPSPIYEYVLMRWINLPAKGWWSGDVHVHHPLLTKAHQEYLLSYAQAADLHVVNLLEMGHHEGTDFKQRAFGPEARVQRGDYALVAGQEEPRSQYGHIIGLNISALVRDLSTYDFYDIAFAGIHRQPDALVGFAHFSWNGCALPRGFPWYVTTEELDFIELMQFGLINEADYYDYLNLGFRLTAAAGSDIPWGSQLGEVRTFVHTGEKFDVDAWFANLRAGHTFVSNGPVLLLTVNDKLPGTEFEFKAGDTARITAKLLSDPSIGLPASLRVVGNDGVIREIKGDGEAASLEVTFEHEISRSCWIAVAGECENGARAHTSPVYIRVSQAPWWSATQAPRIIAKQLELIAVIDGEVAGKDDDHSKGVATRLARAKSFYAELQQAIQESR